MGLDDRGRAKCPVCLAHTLADHCASKGCSWYRCLNRGNCEAVLDLGAARGYKFDRMTNQTQILRLTN